MISHDAKILPRSQPVDSTWPTFFDQPPGLSLILPAYNEEAVIIDAIREAAETLPTVLPRYEIVIVDDGSSDLTFSRAQDEATRHLHVRVIRHERNRGYGAALRTGFEAAEMPLVAFTDADCQFDLRDLARMIPLTESVPIVAGFRVARQDSWNRLFYSWGYNRLIRSLIGTRVRDCDCALKIFRADVLRHLLPETNGFFVNAEMLSRAQRRGLPIAEVGVRHRPRRGGESKVSLNDIPKVLSVLIPYWWKLRRGQGPAVSTGVRECSLEDRGDSLAAADAHGGEAVSGVGRDHRVK